MMLGYIESAPQLSFPNRVDTLERKVIFTLWREGTQCVASLGVLIEAPVGAVTEAVLELLKEGRVVTDTRSVGPFTMCSLSKDLEPR